MASGLFGGVECSVSLFDQGNLLGPLARVAEQGVGVIAKRALGNAPWLCAARPSGGYCGTYWERMQRLAYDTCGLPWDEFALRFSAYQPEVHGAIVGTSSIAHLRHDIAMAEKGALPPSVVATVRQRFQALGAGWRGEV